MRPTVRETHTGAAGGERRVSHLEATGQHLTVEQVRDFLDVAPEHAAVSVGYSHAAELGAIGHSRISIEWDQEETR